MASSACSLKRIAIPSLDVVIEWMTARRLGDHPGLLSADGKSGSAELHGEHGRGREDDVCLVSQLLPTRNVWLQAAVTICGYVTAVATGGELDI